MADLIKQRGGNEEMLDRIQISRCLDIYGVIEAIQEVNAQYVPGLPARDRVGILLIDNITNPMSQLMQRGQSQGHDLMVCMARELTLMSRLSNVCVLVVNTTVNTESKRPREAIESSFAPITNREAAFSDVMIKPALGNTWPHLIDYCLFIHPVPAETKRVPGKRGYIQEVVRSRIGGVGTWEMV